MRRPLIAGNWKMNGSRENVSHLLQELLACKPFPTKPELVVLSPYLYLPLCEQILINTPISWGAQNVSEHKQGAYTGEISASMLLDYHCRYVIVGHSERRTLYDEDNETVAKKFSAALSAGLHPILCVGETENEREQGKTLSIVQEQLAAAFSLDDNRAYFENCVIAYEPLWAIGTGKQATPEQAQEVHAVIREELKKMNAAASEKVRILYGGSVKPDNAKGLLEMPDIDGALVGGASLEAKSFMEIANACSSLF